MVGALTLLGMAVLVALVVIFEYRCKTERSPATDPLPPSAQRSQVIVPARVKRNSYIIGLLVILTWGGIFTAIRAGITFVKQHWILVIPLVAVLVGVTGYWWIRSIRRAAAFVRAIPKGASCLVCREELSEDIVVCRRCHTPQHAACFRYVGGCTTYACGGKRGFKFNLAAKTPPS